MKTTYHSAFTLIELLVVITIIGILAGLSFPAISGALNAAKKAEASAMVNQLKIAMTSYQTEYGVWPGSVTSETAFDADDLYDLLIGEDDPAGDNPRQIVFMEFNSKSLRASASDTGPPADPASATLFVDPWNNSYQMALDTNYDNELTVPSGSIRSSVAVWSAGKDGDDGTKDDITSW